MSSNYLLQTVYLFFILGKNPEFKEAVGFPNMISLKIDGLKEFMKLGLPSLAVGCLENWIFDIMIIFASRISLEATASQMMLVNVTNLFNFPIGGLYNASTILIGRSIGAQ
jgi:Na+-driven multidrug efflux pump